MNKKTKVKVILKDMLNVAIVSTNSVDEFEFDQSKFIRSVDDVNKRLEVKLTSGKCSKLIRNQIARHHCGLGEVFLDKVEYYHGSEICDAIELIEKGKLKGEIFKHSEKIKGLCKAHHSALGTTRSILRNLVNGLGKKILKKHAKNGDEDLANRLTMVHSEVIGTKRRASELTGEWIVYAKVDSLNYYLCLATHEEGEGDGQLIYNKIEQCFDEFPELARFKL